MENEIVFGLWIVALGTLCVSLGFMLKTQANLVELQAHLVKATGELGKAFSGLVGIMGGQAVSDWRQLPPEARAELRASMRKVLAEMEREMN